MSDDSDKYVDKAQVAFVKDPGILKKFCRDHPEDVDDVINYIGNILNKTKQAEQFIVAELHIEERSRSRDPAEFRCCPKWTVLTAKFKIVEKYPNYALNNLYVLYKRTIAKDWMHLKDCGVEQNDDVLYVYVFYPQPRMFPLTTKPKDLKRTDPFLIQQPPGGFQDINRVATNFQNTPSLTGNFDLPDNDIVLPPLPNGGLGAKLWTCKFCTFLNEDWRPGCVMCSSPRPGEELKDEDIQMIPDPIPTSFEEISAKPETDSPGWKCVECTYLNEPTRPGCEICSKPRPVDYQVPHDYVPSKKEAERIEKEKEEEKAAAEQRSLERRENYNRHLSVSEQSIIQSMEPVECLICFEETNPEDTIVLRECLHRFCKDCIAEHVKNSDEAIVTCPYMDDNYNCNSVITHREIKALLHNEDFQKYLNRGLMQAEKESPNSFHCKTPDCKSWCLYEDQVNNFYCNVCQKTNCLTCKAIHEGKNCKEYQDELTRKAATDEEAKKTKILFDKMVKDGDAMHCPQCNIIIQKKIGCDWLRCPMCRIEICWVTKGPRWGPNGRGDTSGGCRCRVGGKSCHKDCNNCH
ncbi:ranBP-type and C3HC4-type zinc finger-containing protein 1-like [Styela clava]